MTTALVNCLILSKLGVISGFKTTCRKNIFQLVLCLEKAFFVLKFKISKRKFSSVRENVEIIKLLDKGEKFFQYVRSIDFLLQQCKLF